LRTTFGSLLCANYVPEQDAIAVERLRAAGAVLIGADLCGAGRFEKCGDAVRARDGAGRRCSNSRASQGAAEDAPAARAK